MSPQYSDEHINAYLDNQLEASERAQLLDDLSKNPELAGKVCKLQKVQDMVQLAYHNVADEQVARKHSSFSNRFAQAAMALLFISTGALLGWSVNERSVHQPTLFEMAQSTQVGSQPMASDELKLMLHVNSGESGRLQTVLDEAEYLLSSAGNNDRKIRIEILTNGEALKLFKKDHNPLATKVKSLGDQYSNVKFMACQIAIDRYEREEKVKIELLPGIEVVPSAIQEAMLRQQDGWTYLRI